MIVKHWNFAHSASPSHSQANCLFDLPCSSSDHRDRRYSQFGVTRDLQVDVVIFLDRVALAFHLQLQVEGRPNRSTSLNNLAVDLFTRYQQLGAMEDLDEAIVLNREALDLRPRATRAPPSLNNLAVDLSTRYNQLEATEDLNEAIVLVREAIAFARKLDFLHRLR